MKKDGSENPFSLPEYWSGRYRRGETGWDNQRPHPYLEEVLRRHPETIRGKDVLVIGAGPGHDAELFSRSGAKRVVALDFSEAAKKSFQKYYPDSRVEYALLDFFHPPPDLKAETVFEHTLLCAIDPARYGDYFRSLQKVLLPGGNYLALIWNQTPAGKNGPPFSTPNRVVEEGLKGGFKILEREAVTATIPGRENTETFFLAERLPK